MANNINITLKRYNGTDNDVLLPTTVFDQIFTDDTFSVNLNTHLQANYIPLTQKGAINGVAPLDGTSKIDPSYLPAAIFGGLKFQGSLNTNTDLAGLVTSVEVEDEGRFWIAAQNLTLTDSSGNVAFPTYGDEGDNTLPITIEAGDWVVLTVVDNDTPQYEFAIVDNDYTLASSTTEGVVKLSDITNLSQASTNDVITESILSGLVGTATGELAAGDHLHDNRYFTETEINNWISGTTTINGDTYTPIEYGATPASTTTGAILIDID